MPFFPWWFLPPPSHTCWRLPAPTEWLVPESHRQPGKWNGLRFSVEHHWFIMQAWISYEMISILKDLYHRRRGINRDYDCKKKRKDIQKVASSSFRPGSYFLFHLVGVIMCNLCQMIERLTNMYCTYVNMYVIYIYAYAYTYACTEYITHYTPHML